jgi:hypothetical protein
MPGGWRYYLALKKNTHVITEIPGIRLEIHGIRVAISGKRFGISGLRHFSTSKVQGICENLNLHKREFLIVLYDVDVRKFIKFLKSSINGNQAFR